MRRSPRIGVTSSLPFLEDGTVHADVAAYSRAVERAGGEPELLSNDVAGLAGVLERCDGFILSGGVDVDIALYDGRREHARSQRDRYRPERDGFEIALVRAAQLHAIPTLCICRGLQLANVAFGGSLIEDIREEFGERYTIDHRQVDDRGFERADYAPGHDVEIEPQSAFARLAGATRVRTNSMHHQAVRVLGAGLAAVGRTPDGVIEAVEGTFVHPFFFAVQWHPEELEDAIGARLFGGLIETARSVGRLPATVR